MIEMETSVYPEIQVFTNVSEHIISIWIIWHPTTIVTSPFTNITLNFQVQKEGPGTFKCSFFLSHIVVICKQECARRYGVYYLKYACNMGLYSLARNNASKTTLERTPF